MVHDDFAQLGELARKTESYSFNCHMHLNEESLLMGNSAKLMITPKFEINERPARLGLLKNITVKVNTKSYIDGTEANQTFPDLAF